MEERLYRPLLIILLGLFCSSLNGQLSITTAGLNYTIDFDSSVSGVSNGAFTGSGFQPSPSAGRLDSDAWALEYTLQPAEYTDPYSVTPTWNYGFTSTAGQPALGLSTGSVTNGGIYSFSGGGISGQALGVQPSANYFANGFIKLKVVNNTGAPISTLNYSYNVYVRNDQARATSLEPSLGYDGVINDGASFDYGHSITSMDHTSTLAASGLPSFIQYPQSEVVTGLYIEPGDFYELYFKFLDAGGSGERDEFAIDDIVINVGTIAGNPIFYSQTSPVNTISGTFNASRQEWSTVPSGGAQYRCFPLLDSGTYVVQNPHVIRIISSGSNLTIDNLIVESGARVQGVNNGTYSTQRYLSLHGDIVCDGQIGFPTTNTNGAGIGFEFEPGVHSISGTGSFSASRLRKSNANLLAGVCSLNINMDVQTHWLTNSLYNNRQATDGGSNQFHVTIGAGTNFTAAGHVGIDNNNPTSNSSECGGSITVEGILNVAKALYVTTNNNVIPVSTTIRNGGRINAYYLISNASGSAGHTLNMEDASRLNINGFTISSDTWLNFDATNNHFNLLDGSAIQYSRAGQQKVLQSIEYRNLIVNGSGNKTVSPALGNLRIHEDLLIGGSCVLQPNGQNLHISGGWTNYHEGGFSETGVSVTFDDASGSSTITCNAGTELYDHLIFNGGTVEMNTDIDVFNDLDLFSRVNLNSNNILIRQPINTSISQGVGYFVSEDTGHQGSISVTVNAYSGFVDFPFGTTTGTPIYARLRLNSGNAGIVTMATYSTGTDNLPWPVAPIAVSNLASTAGYAPDNRTATADRFWSISNTTATYDADLSLALSMSEVVSNTNIGAISNLIGQRYDIPTNQWQPPVLGQTVLNPAFTDPNSILITIPNVTEFSPMAVASTISPLPVELLEFTGNAVSKGIELNWVTASEVNNSHFNLLRSYDLNEEIQIARIEGNGNSSSESQYSYIDEDPQKGWNYYRLIQHDYDGSLNDEGTVAVWWDDENGLDLNSLSWTEDGILLNVSHDDRPYTLSLFSVSGQLIHRSLERQSRVRIASPSDSQAIYILRLDCDEESVSRKLVRIKH